MNKYQFGLLTEVRGNLAACRVLHNIRGGRKVVHITTEEIEDMIDTIDSIINEETESDNKDMS